MLARLKISQKIGLFILAIIILFVGSFYFYFKTTIRQQFEEGFTKKGMGLLQTASINLGPGLYFDDAKFMSSVLKGIENDPDIAFIEIKNKQDEIEYSYKASSYTSFIESFLSSDQIYSYSKDLLFVKQSIFFYDEYMGTVVAGFRLDWINKKVAEQTRNLLIISVILTLVILLLSVFLGQTISKPLKEAANTIKDYSDKDGALDLRLPVRGSDEIAQLATALNLLADNLDSNILELNRSKKYLETLFQLSPVAIIITDTLGQIEEVNESASSFFGIEHKALTKMNLDSFFQSEDLNTIFNRIIQNMDEIRGYVTTLKMTDGSKKVVELNIASNLDQFNYVKNLIIAVIDITEKIQIQREILHNQTKLQRINEELVQKTTELEKVSGLNEKNAKNLGQLIEISQNMMRSSSRRDILDYLTEKGRGLLEATECIIYLKENEDNTLIPIHSSPDEAHNRCLPISSENGDFIWKTYQSNKSGIFNSADFSGAERKLLGLRSKDALSVACIPISEKEFVFGLIVMLKNGDKAFRTEEVHLLNTLANQAAILLENIQLVNALREKAKSLENAYEELQKSQQQVIQLQKMESLGTLVGGIAHDFNNILGIIIPNTDLIKKDANGDPKIERRVSIIADAAHRAADLTRQLLMFSRNQDIQVKVISPNQLVTRVSGMFKRTLGKEYEILLDLDPEVIDIEADETRLTQVMINLAVNARDSMPDGGEIVIRTSMARYKPKSRILGEESDYVCISITDSGCGIKARDLDKIFDPFFTTKSVGKGTGLGLSVVYGIMQSHKGFIEVESEEDEGTTFYLYLPPAEKHAFEVKEDNGKKMPEGDENILVVDDESMIRESVKEILESLGYFVKAVESGVEAVSTLKENKRQYQLAIVDMSMPKMNGVETIRKLKEIDASIKILLSSGHLEREKVIPKDITLDGTLPKPFRLRELALKVRQVLSAKSKS